jgi:aryl-alcohol dehydrogenase-like predicted oxidoreductase
VKPYRERFEKMALHPQDLGFRDEKDWPEIALRFTLSQGGVHTAIIGTTNPDNARANIEIANNGPLPEETVRKIRDAFNKASDGQWPGLT